MANLTDDQIENAARILAIELNSIGFRNVEWTSVIGAARAVLAIAAQPEVAVPAIPDGMALVPIEPTKEMLTAAQTAKLPGQFYPGMTAQESEDANDRYFAAERLAVRYSAMIAAAPQPPDASMQEVTEYQYRTRPAWRTAWSEWERCTAESAADYERVPLLHDWRHEVRRLYLAAPQPPAGQQDRGEELVTSEATQLLHRATQQLYRWSKKYGEWQPSWLPPGGDIELVEDIEEYIAKRSVPMNVRQKPTIDDVKKEAAAAVRQQFSWSDKYRAATASEATAAQQDGWRPIETAPRDGTAILSYDDTMRGDSDAYDICWVGPSGNWWDGEYLISPTHWMPLPAAPANGEGAG